MWGLDLVEVPMILLHGSSYYTETLPPEELGFGYALLQLLNNNCECLDLPCESFDWIEVCHGEPLGCCSPVVCALDVL